MMGLERTLGITSESDLHLAVCIITIKKNTVKTNLGT